MPFTPIDLPFVLAGLGLAMAGRGGGEVRPPTVAGQFYPKEEAVLRGAVEAFLADALPPLAKHPLAIVVPHAGYIYSGQICADGYSQVRGRDVDIVVILGTNHTTPHLRKIALYPGDGFRTPLGTAPVDAKTVAALLAASPDCAADQAPHVREHSIEVQVPFIQILFPKATIVPAVVGQADPTLADRFGAALAGVLKGRRALIVASSDLSHYPSAADGEVIDKQTLEAIASLDPAALSRVLRSQSERRIRGLDTSACGEAPIMAAMAAAKAMGAEGGRVISYANSGDVPIGDRDRVVGYGAVVLGSGFESTGSVVPPSDGDEISGEDKKGLLKLARKTIERFLTTQTVPLPRGFSPAAREPRGVFVTLKKRGDLRGCIGRMVPDRPLATLVGTMALQSAFEDPRFSAVTLKELPDLQIEISVLTPMQPVSGPEEIVVGRDGVLLQKGSRSAVFLPQVAPEQEWGRDEMLDHLSMKAGLPASAWREGTRFSTFQALVFGEDETATG
jgi:AmmeMemoRadiSam system protein B/AmmeMemoRadiSam system protein A